MIRVVSKIVVDFIRHRIYAGTDEFIGTYKIGSGSPIPFRMIRNENTKELIFEPELRLVNTGHVEIIKIEVLRQSCKQTKGI